MINIQNAKLFAQKSIAMLAILIVIGSLAASLLAPNARAETGSLYFAPASASVTQNSIINISVRGNAPEYTGAQINLLYDPSALEYLSYSKTGGALDSEVGYVTTPGLVKITLYTIPVPGGPAVGDQLLATFQFRALKNAGSTEINFQRPQSALVISGQNAGSILDTTKFTVSFINNSTPPPNPTPTPTPAPSPTPTSSASQKPSAPSVTKPTQPNSPVPTQSPQPVVVPPSGDTSKPELRSAQLAGYVGEALSLRIVASEPALATVRYGITRDRLTQSASVQAATDTFYVPLGAFTATLPIGKDCFITIDLTDAAGNKTTTDIFELPIQAVAVQLYVKDANSQPLANTKVIVNGKQFVSDASGVVFVKNVVPGSLAVSVMDGDAEKYVGHSTVVAGAKDQVFVMTPEKLEALKSNFRISDYVSYAIPILSSLVVLVVAYKLFIQFRRHQYSRPVRGYVQGGSGASYGPLGQTTGTPSSNTSSASTTSAAPSQPQIATPAPTAPQPTPQQPTETQQHTAPDADPENQDPFQPVVIQPTLTAENTEPTAVLSPQPKISTDGNQPTEAEVAQRIIEQK